MVTPGSKTQEQLRHEIEALQLPNLHGKTVLDIGAWDGFFSFAAEQRGAKVVSLDHYVWSVDIPAWNAYWQKCQQEGKPAKPHNLVPEVWHPDTLPGKRGYDTAHKALESKAEWVVGNFDEMDLDKLGMFDVVLYLGVLYHLVKTDSNAC